MDILKGFSRLIMGFDVQEEFLCQLLSFENCCIKGTYIISFSDISAVNFIVGWKLLSSLIKVQHLFCYSPEGRKRHCNVSILLAWCYFVGLGLFKSPPCRYLQRTLPFLCQLQPNGFGDNFFH